jgi:hypothetical protein
MLVRNIDSGASSMTREIWKDMLEGVGFAAIVASLIFVGIETRNSTKQAVLTTQALEISSYQELIDNITEMNVLTVQDPEVAAFLFKTFKTSEELTDVEQFRFERAAYQRLRHGDMAYFHYQRGAIDEARLRSVLKVVRLENPRMRVFWDANQQNFIPTYRDYINRLIAEIDSESNTG